MPNNKTMSLLRIHRPNNSLGGARKFKVFMDDKKIGTVSNGETQDFEIPAGEHKIFCMQDFFNTPFIYDVSIKENEIKTLTAAYRNESMFSVVFIFGIILSGILSYFISNLLEYNTDLWKVYFVGFFIAFEVLLLFIMKAAKLFTIYIRE